MRKQPIASNRQYIKMPRANQIAKELEGTLREYVHGRAVDFAVLLVKLTYFVPQCEIKLAEDKRIKDRGRNNLQRWITQWKPVLEELKQFGKLRPVTQQIAIHEPEEKSHVNPKPSVRSTISRLMEVYGFKPTPQQLPESLFDFDALPTPTPTSR